ncbi:MAG: DUF3256 family protein [Prevotellaceae bacterium]|nr:DUF3256 family protein [Prevotellaceae bacterium]MDY3857115.1 DUF3256 family protein [Bacteroidaceae bacterium]
MNHLKTRIFPFTIHQRLSIALFSLAITLSASAVPTNYSVKREVSVTAMASSASATSVGASQHNLRDLIKEMPDSILPLLTHSSRLDLLDYAASGMTARVKGVTGEPCQLISITDRYMSLEESSSTRVEMLLLEQKLLNKQLICFIRTYLNPMPESEVSFYSSDWQPLRAARYLATPRPTDFLILPTGETLAERQQALSSTGVPMISAQVRASGNQLVWHICLDEGFTDIKERLKPYLKDEIIMQWDGNRFK